jgi:hypothetical protein
MTIYKGQILGNAPALLSYSYIFQLFNGTEHDWPVPSCKTELLQLV